MSIIEELFGSHRNHRRVFLAAGAVLAVIVPTLAAGPTASATTKFKVIQLNLCHGGTSGCYTSGDVSIQSAIVAINGNHARTAFVNEICRDDLSKLMEGTGFIAGIFFPARTQTGGYFKCKSGQDYGSGIINQSNYVYDSATNAYTAQNPGTTEYRTWGCARLDWGIACVTHLANSNTSVAMQQCKELMSTNVPNYKAQLYAWDSQSNVPVIVSGDLNLKYNTSSADNVQNCIPSGYFRQGDGDVQHVISSNDFGRVANINVSVPGTDHPGFLVTYKAPW